MLTVCCTMHYPYLKKIIPYYCIDRPVLVCYLRAMFLYNEPWGTKFRQGLPTPYPFKDVASTTIFIYGPNLIKLGPFTQLTIPITKLKSA